MDQDDKGLLERAREGDREAFDELVGAHLRTLRSVVRRMIGHPDDTEDVVQEALLRAWKGIAGFRGEARFGTWLVSIGSRAAIDHLRGAKRWRGRAQVAYANACRESQELGMEAVAVLSSPEHAFRAREHIAYCFTCVGRTLPPEQQAALVLRDVIDLSNQEAATALGLSEPALRHTLSAARSSMQEVFGGLCTLVSKSGVCYQCKGLREATPEPRRGEPVPELASYADRLACVRAADIESGASQLMHDLFWRRTKEIEERSDGSEISDTACGTAE